MKHQTLKLFWVDIIQRTDAKWVFDKLICYLSFSFLLLINKDFFSWGRHEVVWTLQNFFQVLLEFDWFRILNIYTKETQEESWSPSCSHKWQTQLKIEIRENPEEVCGLCHHAPFTLSFSLLLAIHLVSCLTFLMVHLKPQHPQAIETSPVWPVPFWPTIDLIIWPSYLERYLWPILYQCSCLIYYYYFLLWWFAMTEVEPLSNRPQVPEVASVLTIPHRKRNW